MILGLVLLFAQARINVQGNFRSILEYLKDLEIIIVSSSVPLSINPLFS
jgi:hypothetical protein